MYLTNVSVCVREGKGETEMKGVCGSVQGFAVGFVWRSPHAAVRIIQYVCNPIIRMCHKSPCCVHAER